MKSLFKIFVSLSLAVLAVFFTNDVVGSNLNRGEIVGAGAAVSVGYTLIHNLSPEGTFSNANQTVLTELFTGQLIEKLRTMQNWISAVTNRDEYVGNNVIHLNEIGADPTVLINNTVYPIAISNRTDNDVPLALNKYETTNTRITDDELYAITYDKVDSVVNQHKETLAERIGNHIHWSLTPPANNVAAKSFVVRTTGETVGTRKRLRRADLFALQTQMSNAQVPLENRHIILCPEHVEDLLIEDTNLQNQLTDQGNGRASARIAGFNLWFSSYAPHFDNTGAKKAFGSAIVSTDRFASTVFYGPRTWKAYGDTKMYVQLAEAAPTTRETVAGFRQYAAGGLNNLEGSGAVVSAVV
jgi:hypothetical protein